MPRNLYLGIDLGTTNSVAAWSQVNDNGKFVTRAVELRVLDANKREARKPILPSCVYFRSKDDPPIVGEFARSMIRTHGSHVVKSVKSLMGTGKTIEIDGKEYTPAEISSIILRQIAQSSKHQNLGMIPDDAVITIPASFDTDQREDTNEAARMAGFRVTEDDGSPRNIFLREPVAALYDFLSRQDSGEISKSVDFNEPKTVLVFDLGGGTLDISLHEVTRNPEGKHSAMPYDVKPLAVSRHTLMGGDKFDALLRDFFISKIPNFDINSIDESKRELFMSEFLDEAEAAKITLNSDAETYRMQGEDYSGKVSYPVMMTFIGNTDKSFDYDLTLEEYREIMSPYLAPDLTMKSLENLDALSGRTENIIYPILDLLDKAKRDLGHVPKIDAVLMNGGMSKLFAVRERIQKFFGFEPLEAGDPDLAVARGASVYHYWRHLGIKTSEIQNDDIGIAIKGGKVHKLILAGTQLPFETEILEFAIPEDGILWLDLPFYKGTRNDIMPPNRRIASRRIRFNAPQKSGTPINIRASVDEAGTLSLKVWNPESPSDIFTVENIHTDVDEAYTPPEYIAPPGGFIKKAPAPIAQSGKTEDIASLIRQYTKAGKEFADNRIPVNTGIYTARLKELEARIESASNSGEAVDLMAGIMSLYGYISDRAARMLGRLARVSAPKFAAKAVRYLENFCAPERVKFNMFGASQRKLHIQAMAIQALSMLRRPEDEKLFLSIMKLTKSFPVEAIGRELCYALGRTGHTAEAVYAVSEYMTSSRVGERIPAYWALGRIASRERQDKCPASCLEEILPSMFRHLRTENHGDILRNGIYAVGEMCDQRIPGEKVSARIKRLAENFLEETSERISAFSDGKYRQANVFLATSLRMIQGEELSTQQKENLLALRSSYGD